MSKNALSAMLLVFALVAFAPGAENASKLVEVKSDAPTLHCLGFRLLIKGDDNRNAAVSVRYRAIGSAGSTTPVNMPSESEVPWKTGLPLFRPTPEAMVHKAPEGHAILAGSIVDLEPMTVYEVAFALTDPDGGDSRWSVVQATRGEPVAPKPLRTLYVVPGNGGGSGAGDNPFKGLAAADAAAKPGDLLLLGEGAYRAPFEVTRSGSEERPIIYRAAEGARAVIEGPPDAERPGRGIAAADIHDVWFEDLVIRNVDWGVVAHGSQRIVMRRCHIYDVDYGFTCTRNEPLVTENFFLADNVLEGPCAWPREKGIEDPRGFQVSGKGHVVCYNRIRGFSDAVDTFRSPECSAIDIYGNEISEMTDDGIEVDYSQRNVRCFDNRITNVFQGISEQPVFGGPVYIYRNVIYNIGVEPFKMHTSGQDLTSGFLLFHNTCVKEGLPWMVWTNARVNNVVTRNNLFIGTPKNSQGEATTYAMDFSSPMENCDFDYDGFGGAPFARFAKWLGVAYPTLEDLKLRGPVEKHAVLVDAETVFASGVRAPSDVRTQYPVEINDLRLNRDSAAVDAGAPIPGFNDGFAGERPDLGAYELGRPLPHYGPRVDK